MTTRLDTNMGSFLDRLLLPRHASTRHADTMDLLQLQRRATIGSGLPVAAFSDQLERPDQPSPHEL